MNVMKKNNMLCKVLFVLIVGGLSAWYTFKGTDHNAVAEAVKQLNPMFFMYAIGCFVLYLSFEALGYKSLLRKLGRPVGFKRTLGYAMSDFFFSSITPGGSGGQAGQFYYMTKDGQAPSTTLFSLFLFNLIYHVVIIIIAIIALASGLMGKIWDVFLMKPLIIYGVLAQVVFVINLGLMLHSKRFLPKISEKFFLMIRKVKFLKKLAAKENQWKEQMVQYRKYSKWLLSNPMAIIKLLGFISLMLISSYSVPYFIYRGLGFNELSWLSFVIYQGVIVIALESLPIPGGVGVAEHTFSAVFSSLTGAGVGVTLMLLTRVITLYGGVIMGGIGIALLANRKKIILPSTGRVIVKANRKVKKLVTEQ